jgi:hypothetical protein
VFAVTKPIAETLAQMLDETFMDKKGSLEVRYADYVASGMGKDDTLDGMSKIRRLSVKSLCCGLWPRPWSLIFLKTTPP